MMINNCLDYILIPVQRNESVKSKPHEPLTRNTIFNVMTKIVLLDFEHWVLARHPIERMVKKFEIND